MYERLMGLAIYLGLVAVVLRVLLGGRRKPTA